MAALRARVWLALLLGMAACDGGGGGAAAVDVAPPDVGGLPDVRAADLPVTTCEDPRFRPPDCTECAAGYAGTQCDRCEDPAVCDDHDPCTIDTCAPPGRCTHAPAPAETACDDGDPCTDGDRCVAGACAGAAPHDCDDAVDCTEDRCLAGVGCVHAPVDARCADADPCTEGGCDPARGCVLTALTGVPCSDGNPCTDGDACAAGACVAGPNGCACETDADCPAPADRCLGALVCDVAGAVAPHHTCRLEPAHAVVCDPSGAPPCRAPVCDPATGACALRPAADGTPCDEGSACRLDGTCQAGVCVPGALLDCDDGNPCTADVCAAGEGCRHTAHDGPCDDGDPCSTEEVCADGSCSGVPFSGAPEAREAPCTRTYCRDGVLEVTPATEGAHCYPTDVCDGWSGRCRGGACVPEGAPAEAGLGCTPPCGGPGRCDGAGECLWWAPACDDGNPCTVDRCDPATGCQHEERTGPCDDGEPCTAGDTCVVGRCVGTVGLCACAADADCAVHDDGRRCTGDVVCDEDGALFGLAGNCALDSATVPRCAPWPGGVPAGIVAECVEAATGARCSYRLADDSELLADLQAIYRGAAIYYGRGDRLNRAGSLLGRQFPDNQAITPVEGTCCNAFGGPDWDGDDRCEQTWTYFDTDTWSALGFHSLIPADPDVAEFFSHELIYEFWQNNFVDAGARFEIHVLQDADCEVVCQHRFRLASGAAYPASGTIAAPETLVHELDAYCPDEGRLDIGPIALTPAQRRGFVPDRLPPSQNPYFAEVETNLQRLLEGAVAWAEQQPPGACEFPDTARAPWESSCCGELGGPDVDGDRLCDEWQAPPDEPGRPGWDAAGFAIEGPFAFVYELAPQGGHVEARAYGDLDCDSIQSTFTRFARFVSYEPGASCDAVIVPGYFIHNEVE